MTSPPPPPPASPLELTKAVMAAAQACALATSEAIAKTRAAVAAGSDLQSAGAIAATAQQAALATQYLCQALASLQGPGPIRAATGTPPPMYDDTAPPPAP